MQSKEFISDSHKLYEDIAYNRQEVSVINFGEIYSLLPRRTGFLESRNIVAKSLLDSLRFVGLNDLKGMDYVRFAETPMQFNRRVVFNSDLDVGLREVKDIMILINEIYGHYSVSVKLIGFLLDRDASNYAKNQELIEKNALLLKEIDELKKQLVKEPVEIGVKQEIIEKLEIKTENPLTLTPEEKQQTQNITNKEKTEENQDTDQDFEIVSPENSPFLES
jgi:hypothetical protein